MTTKRQPKSNEDTQADREKDGQAYKRKNWLVDFGSFRHDQDPVTLEFSGIPWLRICTMITDKFAIAALSPPLILLSCFKSRGLVILKEHE